MNSGNKHQIGVPRTVISAAGARTVGPTGALALPTGVGKVPVPSFASVDPAQPNPLYDSYNSGTSIVFSVGGLHHAVNPSQNEGT